MFLPDLFKILVLFFLLIVDFLLDLSLSSIELVLFLLLLLLHLLVHVSIFLLDGFDLLRTFVVQFLFVVVNLAFQTFNLENELFCEVVLVFYGNLNKN